MQYQSGVLVQLLSGHLLSEFIFGPSLREHVTLFVRCPLNSSFKKGCTNSLMLVVLGRTAKEDVKRGTALVWRLVS